MNATAADQERLLELAKLDAVLARLEHRAKSLPEHDEIASLERRMKVVRDLIVASETECSDIEKEVTRAEADVEQVRARAARDDARLNSGQGAAKDLESLQHEVATLARRQLELEEVELEILERLELAQSRLDVSVRELSELTEKLSVVQAALNAVLAEITNETAATVELREILASQIDSALLALYTKISESVHGIGAAELHQRRCQGCRLEINATDIARFRDAPATEVLRCEECRRILIRTATSGL